MLVFLLTLIDDPNDEEKFIRLYQNYRRDMIAIAYGIIKDYGLSEDVIQECFMYIATKIKLYDESKNIRAVLCCLAKNRALNKVKQYRKNITYLDETYINILIDPADIESSTIGKSASETIMQWVKSLPSIYSDIIILKYQCGLSEKEIAQMLNVEHATVRKRMERIRKKAAEYLHRMEEEQ